MAPPIFGNLVSNRPRTGRSLIFNRETKLISPLVLFPNYSSEVIEFTYNILLKVETHFSLPSPYIAKCNIFRVWKKNLRSAEPWEIFLLFYSIFDMVVLSTSILCIICLAVYMLDIFLIVNSVSLSLREEALPVCVLFRIISRAHSLSIFFFSVSRPIHFRFHPPFRPYPEWCA